MEERTFANWINSTLQRVDVTVKDIATDLADGTVLIQLAQELIGKKIPKWNKTPNMRVKSIENANIALEFILASGVKLHNIGAAEIVDGNRTIILGLMWQLIHHFRVQSIRFVVEQDSAGPGSRPALVSGEEALLRWCQRAVSLHDGIAIANFTSSWTDGLAFCAILESHFPSELDFTSARDQLDALGRLTLAFNLAENILKVPQLLEPSDLLGAASGVNANSAHSAVSAHSVILYVALLQQSIAARLDSAHASESTKAALDQIQKQLSEERSQLQAQLSTTSQAALKTEEERQDAVDRLADIQARLADTEHEKASIQNRLEQMLQEETAEKTRLRQSHDAMMREMEQSQSVMEQQLADEEKRRIEFEKQSKLLASQLSDIKSQISSESDSAKQQLADAEERVRRLTAMLEHEHEQVIQLQLSRNKVLDDLQESKKATKAMLKRMQEYKQDMAREYMLREGSSSRPQHPKNLRRSSTVAAVHTKKIDPHSYLTETASVKEGWLTKESGGSKGKMERRFFRLEGLELQYFRDPLDKDARKTIPISSSVHISFPNDPPNAFTMLTPNFGNRKFLIIASSEKERMEWVNLIQERVGFATYVQNITSLGQDPDGRVLEFFCRQAYVQLNLDESANVLQTISAISVPLCNHDALQVLSLNSSNLSDVEVTVLARALASNKSVQRLYLSHNSVKTDGCKELADMLRRNTSLTSIDLSQNQIDDAGIGFIAVALPAHRNLIELNLDGNRIGNGGAKLLAEGLGASHVMPSLQLAGNAIEAFGAKFIGLLIETNSSITSIDLSGNNIANKGFMDIASALVENSTLTSIRLGDNGITDDVADVLALLFQQNRSLVTVDLSANSIGPNLVLSLNSLPNQAVFYSDFTIQRKVWDDEPRDGTR